MFVRGAVIQILLSEPVVVRGAERSSLGSRQTMGDSSDDTLDTSGEEDNKDTVSCLEN